MTNHVTGPRQLVATFADYLGAQRLVDRMSDEGFPVEHVRIIGTVCAWWSRPPAA